MIIVTKWLRATIATAWIAAVGTLAAQPVGQWNFAAGNLSATVGSPLTTSEAVTFPTAGGAGIPLLPAGVAAQPVVMQFPKAIAGGIQMPVPNLPNGTAFAIDMNNWTLIMDVAYPAASSGLPRSLIDIKTSGEAEGAVNGPEVLVDSSNALSAGGQGDGVIAADSWHRVAITASYTGDDLAGQALLTKYIDGSQVGVPLSVNTIGPDGWMALKAGLTAKIFADNNTTNVLSEIGYVSSIQLRDIVLNRGQIAAIGGPSTDKIPAVIPPVPSFVVGEDTLPNGAFSRSTTDVRFVIAVGDSVLTGIQVKVDGVDVTSSSSITDGVDGDGLAIKTILYNPSADFALSSDHTAQLNYNDSLTGARTVDLAFRVPLMFEDFELTVLGPAIDKGAGLPGASEAYSPTPPTNWMVDQTSQDGLTVMYGVDWVEPPSVLDPNNGAREYRGWTFLNKDWWVSEAGQDREQFLKGNGTVAVADPDQWDDKGGPEGQALGSFNSKLVTPLVDISGAGEGTAYLAFDSSTRSEEPQELYLDVSIDGGVFVEILRWTSTPGPTLKADATNERISLPLNNPIGASTVQVRFGVEKALNDWWWSVDNIVVDSGPIPVSFTQQPVGGNVAIGSPMTFTVGVGGTEPFTYQWYFDNGVARTAIGGATGSSYTIASVALANTGSYSVDVTNGAGTQSSSGAFMYVLNVATPSGDVAGQWNFEGGNLNATVGANIVYFEGVGGATEAATAFGSTTTFGISDIGGTPANVMRFGAPGPLTGYVAATGAANGGPAAKKKNVYTMVYDILWPAAVDANWRTFAQITPLNNTDDAEFFVNTSGAVGVGNTGYHGQLVGGVWHRVVISVDLTVSANPVRYYIDGTFIGQGGTPGLDGRFGLPGAVNFFADNDGDNRPGYISSLQVRNVALTSLEAAALGGPTAAGIPLVIDTSGIAPFISVQPVNTTVTPGQTLTLSVNVQSGTSVTYQWKRNNVNIAAATGATYTIDTILAGEGGDYTVTVTNGAGSTTSAVALVKVPVITDDLVAHLTFDTVLTDSSGTGNNGTGVGSVSFVPGVVGQALRYSSAADGSSFNYVTLGAPASLNFGVDIDFSISFWTTFSEWTGDPAIIANKSWASGGNAGWIIATAGDARVQWNIAPSRTDYDSPGGVLAGGWHHVVVSFDRDGQTTTYVDGQLIDSRSSGALHNVDTPAGQATNIGQDGTGGYTDGGGVGIADGTVDDVGIWSRILTAPEVASIYQRGLAGNDLTSASGVTLGAITYVPNGATVQLDWRGQPGAVVQRAELVSGPWTTIPGTAGASTYTVMQSGFYRLFMP